ncbi:MAG: hypothetical protein SFV81_17490 [Pirellulaceae bacterium]|nr:hypothetical protein [Pirellulaceae bacterium]
MVVDDKLSDSKPSEPSSRKAEARVSTSKSGFTDKEFVLVFKQEDGTYSSPTRIPKEVALSIAKDLASKGELAARYGINEAVAKFIMAKAIRKGLVSRATKSVEELDLSDIATDSIERPEFERSEFERPEFDRPDTDSSVTAVRSGQVQSADQPKAVERQPKYFPVIDPYLPPELPRDTIETIAFVLSGVDPEQRRDPRVVQGTLNLRQLIQMSIARISPGLLMQEDHWYVLTHLHTLKRDAFKLAWEEAQTQATGQANTNVVKVMTKLDKFRIDSTAKCLDDPTNKSFFLEVQEKSVELLSRNFRRIRRKIESVYEQSAPPPPKKNWLDSLFKRKSADKTVTSPVQAEVQSLVIEYLNQSIKIGRILRSDVLKQHR